VLKCGTPRRYRTQFLARFFLLGSKQHDTGRTDELIENGSPAFRAVYCCKYLDTAYVLHAFEKTTNGVDQKEMITAAKRYKEMKAKVDAARKLAMTSAPSRKK